MADEQSIPMTDDAILLDAGKESLCATINCVAYDQEIDCEKCAVTILVNRIKNKSHELIGV